MFGSIERIRDLLTKTEKEIGPILLREDQRKLIMLLDEIRKEANYCVDICNILPVISNKDSVELLTSLYGKKTLDSNEYTVLVSHIETLSTDVPDRKDNMRELSAFWIHFLVHNKDLAKWVYKNSPRSAEVEKMILNAMTRRE